MILLDLLKHWLVLFAVAGRSMEETYRCLIEKLQSKADETSKPYWVAIGGGPGSGKTTLANEICSRLNEINPDSTVVIPMDGWHIPKEKLIEQFGTESMRRRGAPWTFDFNLMYKQLTAAKVKGEASLPIYSREISDPVPNKVNLQPFHRFVLVEGLYLLWKDDKNEEWSKLFDLWDERWFVQCPSQEEQIERLVSRSMKTWTDEKAQVWGKGRDGALARIKSNDLKNADIIRHCHQFADEIIINI